MAHVHESPPLRVDGTGNQASCRGHRAAKAMPAERIAAVAGRECTVAAVDGHEAVACTVRHFTRGTRFSSMAIAVVMRELGAWAAETQVAAASRFWPFFPLLFVE
jgi:hypothetical protein